MTRIKWIKMPSGSLVLPGAGFYISFNPHPNKTVAKYTNKLEGYNPFTDRPETAVYLLKQDEWLVLEGDFRKEFEKCNTLIQCYLLYRKLRTKHKSAWSTR